MLQHASAASMMPIHPSPAAVMGGPSQHPHSHPHPHHHHHAHHPRPPHEHHQHSQQHPPQPPPHQHPHQVYSGNAAASTSSAALAGSGPSSPSTTYPYQPPPHHSSTSNTYPHPASSSQRTLEPYPQQPPLYRHTRPPVPTGSQPLSLSLSQNSQGPSPSSTSYLPTPPLQASGPSGHGGQPGQPPHKFLQQQQLQQQPWQGATAPPPHHYEYSRPAPLQPVPPAHRSSNSHLPSPLEPPSRRSSGSGTAMQQHRSRPPYDDGRVGVEDPCSDRKYTEIKMLGDGSFGTVWLCDWHSPVRPEVMLSAMQCGAGARSEWTGKRLVAVKRMKRVWEGGWAQAKTLGELVSLRKLSPHPAIIPLYDAFISPTNGGLFFVFECMEGNLYQLTKSRKGKPFVAGLIASCFHQLVGGLHHIHRNGYFHRDLKPENLLVTTTGLCDYLTIPALREINDRRKSGYHDDSAAVKLTPDKLESDVQVIIKLADFGLARAIDSTPPYTEYVSTRWYRAPEVLLRSPQYGAPVDMWALGTILAEVINLKPLFPGVSEHDQVYRIAESLGEPSDEFGVDERGRPIGGGAWATGVKMSKKMGFQFPKKAPKHFNSLFPKTTPMSLIDCIADLLRYDPKRRITAAQCTNHPYFHETLPHIRQTPLIPEIPFHVGQPPRGQRQSRQAPPQQQASQPPQQPAQVQPQPPIQAQPAPADARAHASQHLRVQAPQHMPVPPPQVSPNEIRTPEQAAQMQQQQQQQQQPHLFPASVPLQREGSAASAIVHQLRALEMPRDDLSPYRRRGSEDRRSSMAHPMSADTPGGSPSHPNASYVSLLSSENLDRVAPSNSQYQQQPNRAPPHVLAYVNQQAAYQHQQTAESAPLSTPNLVGFEHGVSPRGSYHQDMSSPQSESTTPSPLHPASPDDTNVSLPSVPLSQLQSKKNRWNFGSVSRKNLSSIKESLPHPGLKRTQSGSRAQDREGAPPPAEKPLTKKQQERELALAKREAADRAQKERARAVLAKRNQLIAEIGPKPTDAPFTVQHGSSRLNLNDYDMGTYELINSNSTLAVNGEAGNESDDGASSRSKARKTTEDDDHSSLGRYKGRAVINGGSHPSLDSRRLRDMWPDGASSGRRPSGPQPAYSYRGARSTPSLPGHWTGSESSLASQWAIGVNVASESCLIQSQHLPYQTGPRPVSDLYTYAPQHNRSHPGYAPVSPTQQLPPFSTIAEVADHRGESTRAV